VRLEGRKKLGYFPLPEEHGPRICARLSFPEQLTYALDPCAGTGAALQAITSNSGAELYAIELDANRADAAKHAGLHVIHGNVFDVRARVERLSLLYLNPPYDFEIGPLDNKRMERLFLQHTYAWLKPKGVLVMVIPGKALLNLLDTLATRFKDVRVYRMDGDESRKYDQYAVFGVRHNNTGRDADAINRSIRQEMLDRASLPALTDFTDAIYQVPAAGDEVVLSYTGIPLDEVEDKLSQSVAWRHAVPLLLPREEVAGGRPITPLHGGHVGLLATAGMLNGVFGTDEQKHIARWRPVKHTTTITEVENGVKIVRTKERFSNELALVFATGQTLILNESKKEEEAVPVDPGQSFEMTEEPTPNSAVANLEQAVVEQDFRLGKVAMSDAVIEFAERTDCDLHSYLERHSQGDWGEELSYFDRRRNDEAVNSGDGRILSCYTVPESPEGKLWIITEANRLVTTICFPSEQ
jgi:predicted RNA methylase